jgi:hypothetical protein
VTREQLIVLGFIAAAFVVGWVTRALTGERDRRAKLAPASEAAAPAGSGEPRDGALLEEVTDALRNDAANASMLEAVSADREGLSEVELDLTDWGFTYGVAWARARERDPSGAESAIAHEALSAAGVVFRDYTRGSDWRKPIEERRQVL